MSDLPSASDIARILNESVQVRPEDCEVDENDPLYLALLGDSDGAASADDDNRGHDRTSAQLAYLFTVLSAQHDHLRASAVALNRDGRKAEALAALTSSKQIAALRARLLDAGGGLSSTRASQESAKLELEAFLATLAPLPSALVPARPASPPPTMRTATRPAPAVSCAISLSGGADSQLEDDFLVPAEPSDEEVDRAMREMELGVGAARPIVAASVPRPAPLPPQGRESPLKPPVRAVAPAASKAVPVAIDNSFQREIEEERVFERLRQQVEQLAAEAVAALARQQKELALVIMRRKKASERDRDEARRLLDAGERLPAHRVDRIAFEREVVLPDVSADDVQLRIERIVFREAAAKQGYTPYVVAKFTETAQADEIASGVVPCLADVSSPFETKTEHVNPAAGGVAQFPNHVANMRLPRKDPKIGKRVATSCRFVFEVWHRRVLWSHLSLGTAEVRLKDLAAHCATTQVVAVRDAQKTTVGDLHVTIRVQTPLVSKQVEKVVIDCISFVAAATTTVDSTSVSSPAPMAAATAIMAAAPASAAASATPLQVNYAASAAASSSAASALSAPPPSALSAKVPATAAVIPAASALLPNPEWPLVTESDIADPMSVKLLDGMMVFEAEKSAIEAKLQICQNQAEIASLNGRLQLIVIKSDDLLHRVQTEELSLPAYLEFLRAKIAHHEQLVRALTDRGRTGDARAVSERVKIMQDEVDSAAGM